MPTKSRRRDFTRLQLPQCVQYGDKASKTGAEIEDSEIIRHAREKYKAGEIDKRQLHDVYRLVSEAMTEREIWEQSKTQ